ncbi:ubiquinone biosynthesis protein UbiB [Ramlibacter sp. G-1-2-2]|uniref:Ubiquinone biosynthesis protein UbiB n=1 Tax=Ramlibacter agri TaxID=2728837 RepID=A0A848HFP2_9BURK|nr:AarF/UbiB family protein [Ramlibacter agri]NML48280.1 ubiquinone biosynthesis protein UbiB [Ramlibacter agri]
MLWQALASMRDLARLYEIASVLVRYGFGDMVRRMGLADTLERAGRVLRWQDASDYAHLAPPARVRRAMEDLGPAFVKLGQVLATRLDLFEPEWIAEFSQLHDHARPVPYEAMRVQLTEDLGGPPEEMFARFDPEPVAAASLAQVYRAQLPGGEEVVVKARRPGIRPVVEADLRLLMRLAELVERESPELRALRPRQLVHEFTQSLLRELDFSSEARNARRMAQNFAGYRDEDAPPAEAGPSQPLIVIPRVFWDCERACVQEFIDGIPGTQLARVDAAGLDRRVLARRGARAVLKMILQDGFFHADPHPGNVFYLPGNRIAFIDFGMVGRLTEQRREQLLRLLLGLVQQRAADVADVLADWAGDDAPDLDALLLALDGFVDQYRGVPLAQLRLGAMLNDAVGVLRQHRLTLPPDLGLLVKAFISLEGMGRELDPDFDMAGQAAPILERAVRDSYSPRVVFQRGWRSLLDAASLVSSLPRDLSRLMRAARRGRIDVQVEVRHLQRLGNQLDRAVSRLVVGVVVAALIVGSSIVMTVPGGLRLFGWPVLGLLGFLGAVAGGLWLLVSIWRSGRSDADRDD